MSKTKPSRSKRSFPIKDLPALIGVRDHVTAHLHSKASFMQPERFFLGSDDSGHTYVVPEARRESWRLWCAIPEDDEASWNVPKWATRIDGAHSITFVDWREES